MEELRLRWSVAHQVLSLPSHCRVLSGPFVHHPETTLGSLCIAERCVYRAKSSRHLVLTISPALSGGGAKTDTKAWAATKVAASCLAQGMSLSTAPNFAEQLVSQCGNKKLEQALHAQTDSRVWQSVQALAQEAGVAVPELNPKNAAAEVRLKKARAQKRLAAPAAITPEEVALQPGHFRNADGTETPILSSLTPGASGVFLTTKEHAMDVLHTLAGSAVDELAILILGHDCPASDTCGGSLVFPVVAKQNHAPLLLAGCIHNVGPTLIRPKLSSEASVCLPKVRLFQFDMLAREIESEEWLRVVQAPVRAAQDRFTEAGIPRAITEPWARRFTLNGRPAQPEASDRVTFMGKVPEEKADSLMKASGHNHVFLTPRDEALQLCSSFAVIWLGDNRHEAVKACMTTPEQLGLAYTRSRYGIRVLSANFERVHAALKPDVPVPSRIKVAAVFRLGPVPASAGPMQIQEWAQQLHWPLRILKPSGHRHWQVGAAGPPPASVLGWDGDVILVTPVEHGARPAPVIKSGRMPKTGAKSHESAARDVEGTDPWIHSDPWRHAKLPSKPQPSALPEPRTAVGPVEARLQSQDHRLNALEADLQSLRKEHQQQRQEDRASFSGDLEGVQQQMQAVSKDVSEQLRLSVQTLQDAQLRQQAQMQSSLEELKQLFMNPPTLAKKARKDEEPSL